MAVTHSFRNALGGFHKEDVVHYIEYLNSKHSSQINQLTSEAEELRAKLKALEAAASDNKEKDALEARCGELTVALDQAKQDKSALEAQLAQQAQEIARLNAQMAEREQSLATKELEAYRRAEQAERLAKERADAIYQQAAGTLAQATTQVDQAAATFRQIADQVSGQMSKLQQAVDSSKNALLDAATTMYAIRPEQE